MDISDDIPSCTIMYATTRNNYEWVMNDDKTVNIEESGYGVGFFILEEEAESWGGGVWRLGSSAPSFSFEFKDATFSTRALSTLKRGHKFRYFWVNYIPPREWPSCVKQIERLIQLLDEEDLWSTLGSRLVPSDSQKDTLASYCKDMISGCYALNNTWSGGRTADNDGGMKMTLCYLSDMTWDLVKDVVPADICKFRERIKGGLTVLWT